MLQFFHIQSVGVVLAVGGVGVGHVGVVGGGVAGVGVVGGGGVGVGAVGGDVGGAVDGSKTEQLCLFLLLHGPGECHY